MIKNRLLAATVPNELTRYFTSGNSVPVERATILAADFERITGMVPIIGEGTKCPVE